MGFKRSKPDRPTVNSLAYRFLEGRYPISRMFLSYGRKRTKEVISATASALLCLDPDHAGAQGWEKRMKNESY